MVRRRFRNDTHGDVLGLPLYLLILIIVVVLGLGVIWIWFDDIFPPEKRINDFEYRVDGVPAAPAWGTDPINLGEPDVGSSASRTINSLIIKVYVSEGSGKGALVTLSGCGTNNQTLAKTGGEATFTNLRVTLNPGDQTGTINIKIINDGYIKLEDTIMVARNIT